ncbi:hypothetical protein [Armatimonas rosea]|uniref:Membrane protein YfhO n=1 Tax=Armatimonas rosea TaxID=685828 RepID=A0A7W9W8F6_ARMRO|nr:hypothetical protein [Armatimonas rosea]MBB6052080.1 hypothetical protein [Armatimonas rosea]
MRARGLVAAFLLFLTLLLFHRPLFLGEAFLPADQLTHLAPWKGTQRPPVAWNVLRFDGITQFYPWRLQVARSWRQGQLPLTNPYAFSSEGGTPLLANSQSAPLYPPNLIFTLLGETNLWYGFGLSAALHLLLAAAGIYRLARALGVSRTGALLACTTFSLSAPVICWLSLPTFLCAAAWLPWLLLAIHRRSALSAGLLGGLVLLSGHLQVALFVLLSAGAYAIVLYGRSAKAWGGIAVAGALALCLAAPQVLPSLELSKQSHRAATGRPDLELFRTKSALGLPPQSLLTFTAPNFFGNPTQGSGVYWNANRFPDGGIAPNNYAEWANYIGVVPLLLALLGAMAAPKARFFAGLALYTLLMAFGTWANLPFFFLVPGWAQTDNPGRILVISAFALALLAGFGLDALPKASVRLRLGVLVGVVFSLAIGLALAMNHVSSLPKTTNITWADVLAMGLPGLMLAVVWLVLGAAVLLLGPKQPLVRPVAVGLAALDLLSWGWGYNTTLPAKAVYPVTPGIAWLQSHAKDALIAPLNDQWSNGIEPPLNAVLPPNSLTVYGLHDLAGYDSLFYKTAKDRIQAATSGDNPCPQQNGNIVFIKTVEAAVALGAKYIVASPDRPLVPAFEVVYSGPDLVIYHNPAGTDAPPPSTTVPGSLKLGLALSGLALLAYSSASIAKARSKSSSVL